MRIPFTPRQLARALWTYVGGAAGTTADRAVNTTFWNGTAVTAPNTAGTPVVDVVRWNGTAVAAVDTAGYPKVTIKDGSGAGELLRNSGFVRIVKSIQYNTVTITAGTSSGTTTLGTTVTAANAVLIWLGQTTNSTDTANFVGNLMRITLTNGTTVTGTTANNVGAGTTAAFCVVEFYTIG